MLKLDPTRLPQFDGTPVKMTVIVPCELADFIKSRATTEGIPHSVLAGQLVEDSFVQLAEEEMMELRLDPKALDPYALSRAYEGHYGLVKIDELSAMSGLSLPFLRRMNSQDRIPGRNRLRGQHFVRIEAVPWVFSDECQQLHAAYQLLYPPTP